MPYRHKVKVDKALKSDTLSECISGKQDCK